MFKTFSIGNWGLSIYNPTICMTTYPYLFLSGHSQSPWKLDGDEAINHIEVVKDHDVKRDHTIQKLGTVNTWKFVL